MNPTKPFYYLIAMMLILASCSSKIESSTNFIIAEDSLLPIKSNQVLNLEVTEGTSINPNVSPDTKSIVFDLLGDIYTMSINGGKAKQITQGLSWDVNPVWSPDGKYIGFISDRSGSSNIWIMNIDGTDPKQITDFDFKDTNKPVSMEWLDSKSIIQGSGRIGNGPGSVFSISGESLITRIEAPINLIEVRKIRRTSNIDHIHIESLIQKTGNTKVWRYNKKTKDTTCVVNFKSDDTSKSNVVISNNGKWVVFSERRLHSWKIGYVLTAIKALNTETNEEKTLIPFDYKVEGKSQRYSFIGTTNSIVIINAGKFYKINLENGKKEAIPFIAKPKINAAKFTINTKTVSKPNTFYKNILSADISPNGQSLVFSVNRKLYLKNLKTQTIQLLLKENTGQFQPVFSPDGNSITYVTWNDGLGGDVRILNLLDKTSKKITTTASQYQYATWSPNGKYIAVLKTDETEVSSGGFHAVKGELQLINTKTNSVEILKDNTPLDYNINFNIEGTHLYYKDSRNSIHSINIKNKETALVSNILTGLDFRSVSEICSPDGKFVAFVASGNVYLNKLTNINQKKLVIDSLNNTVDLRITPAGGRNPKWKNNGKTLTWLSANTFHEATLESLFKKDAKAIKKEVIELKIEKPTYNKVIALTNARIISMKDNEVIENGAIIIEGNRIKALGKTQDVKIPNEAFIKDCKGKTIIPGLIDMHMHAIPPNSTLNQNWWSYLVSLSYGVTTMRDPSNQKNFAYEERIQSGDMTAPRLYGAAAIGSYFTNITSFEDALALAKQYKSMGATFFKIHDSWSRKKRQWMVKAAHQENLNITTHPSPDNHRGGYNMSTLQDGFNGIEHTIWEDDIVYDDVKQLVAKSGIWYTPTFGSYGYFIKDNQEQILKDPREKKFNYFLDKRIHRSLNTNTKEEHEKMKIRLTYLGKDAKDMQKLGAKVSIGSHGDYPGLGMHWALQTLQMGGFTPHEALQSATIVGAEGLGMKNELGSLEVGKLADLIILDKNPLQDIKNTQSAVYVMVDGKMYEANSLEMVWPYKKSLPDHRIRK